MATAKIGLGVGPIPTTTHRVIAVAAPSSAAFSPPPHRLFFLNSRRPPLRPRSLPLRVAASSSSPSVAAPGKGVENVVIIGSGPAGYTAAIYAARANLKPVVFEGYQAGGVPGGQLMTTTEVENFPGFPDGISGPDLMDRMRRQAERWGAELYQEDVEAIDVKSGPFTVQSSERKVKSHTVIYATGATAKRLRLPREDEFWSRGISACAICDGASPLFKGQVLAVVGGGDTATEEALYLTKYARHVHLLVRREQLRASKAMQDSSNNGSGTESPLQVHGSSTQFVVNPLGHNDLPSLHQSYRLDGSNYLSWSQLIRTTIKSRGKIDHLDGPAPAATDPNFVVWDNEDSLIMTWLWNSMTPEVGRHCMFLSSAKEIWETVRSTYSLKQDMAVRYELRNKIFSTKQDSLSVTAYYGVLKELWTELDQFQSLKMQCTKDAIALTKAVEDERIFDFLAGLNSEYDPIRVQILGKDSLPSLFVVFNTVRGEETRRGVMMHNVTSDKSAMLSSSDVAISKTVDGSAMVSTRRHGSSQGNSFNKIVDNASSKFKKDDRWCSYCKRSGHLKDLCFRLHRKQKVYEKMTRMRGQAHLVSPDIATAPNEAQSGTSEFPSISRDELERLRTILDSLSKQSDSDSSALAMTGSHHREDDWGS